jgi:biotin-dependent carboxylase-like uncharacterized protein
VRTLRVRKPGLSTTVEDLGRRGVGLWGVPRGGAFDAQALAAANLLVGNDPRAAGLEITLRAPELELQGEVDVATVGADCALTATENGVARALRKNVCHRLAGGTLLSGGYAKRGARAWLAFGGGIDVPPVLGSRATERTAAFGGFQGRALAAGDLLPLANPVLPPRVVTYPDPIALEPQPLLLRVLSGPQRDSMPGGFVEAFEAAVLAAARDSDRIGVRFERIEGPPLPSGWPREIEPEGAAIGSVQLPAEGTPIVLGVDGPTTGGYAKPAVVIRADLGLVARLAPGMTVRFRFVSRAEADAAAAEMRLLLAELGG